MRRFLFVFLLLTAFSTYAFACFVYGGGVAYLNKPGASVNINPIIDYGGEFGVNYAIRDGVIHYRSHYDERLLVSIQEDEFGWLVSIGEPGASPYEQPQVNWAEALYIELDWLGKRGVVSGLENDDFLAIRSKVSETPTSYAYWKNGEWAAIQNNCKPSGECMRCGPAGVGLDYELPDGNLDIPVSTGGGCGSGFLLFLLLPLLYLFAKKH